jgi:D-lyxose ketol-isomerase
VYADQDGQHRTYEVREEHKRKREKAIDIKGEQLKSELMQQKTKAEEEEDKKAKELPVGNKVFAKATRAVSTMTGLRTL